MSYTNTNTKADQYLVQKIMTASSEELVAYVYNYGATACMKKDADQARRAVQLLISNLNFDVKDISVTFYNVYRHLQHLINWKKFSEAQAIFVELRDTWKKAFKLNV